MKPKFIIFLLVLAALSIHCLSAANFSVTIQVVDDSSLPVENAVISNITRENGKSSRQEFKTGKDGKVHIKNSSDIPWVGCRINKEGYYESSNPIHFIKKNKILNQWELKDDQIVVTLRKILNPTKMYAQQIKPLKIPVYEKKIGFDLLKGDWVKPYGVGLSKDFIFIFKRLYKKGQSVHDPSSINMDMTFNNKLDGIVEYKCPENFNVSNFVWPYEVENLEFKASLMKFKSYNLEGVHQRKSNIIPEDQVTLNKGYIFRVRTMVDSNGKIVAAKYGKIQGDFQLYSSGYIKFTYYYNPTGNKSLEFNLSKNLFNWSQEDYERTTILKP